jgi:hypothetical protein
MHASFFSITMLDSAMGFAEIKLMLLFRVAKTLHMLLQISLSEKHACTMRTLVLTITVTLFFSHNLTI